jgi:hypothetical protein
MGKAIVKGTTLYSLTEYDSQGFPSESVIKLVKGSIIYTKHEAINIADLGRTHTADWLEALSKWPARPHH